MSDAVEGLVAGLRRDAEYLSRDMHGSTAQMIGQRSAEAASALEALEARALAAEAKLDKAIEALREISCPTQTLDLLWWQTRARSTLNEIAP